MNLLLFPFTEFNLNVVVYLLRQTRRILVPEERVAREERNSISPMRQDLDRDEFRV